MSQLPRQRVHDTITPAVIIRNVSERVVRRTLSGEIAQGRLESLLNFQTMVCDFTGMGSERVAAR
jgi:glycine dehydrogenase